MGRRLGLIPCGLHLVQCNVAPLSRVGQAVLELVGAEGATSTHWLLEVEIGLSSARINSILYTTGKSPFSYIFIFPLVLNFGSINVCHNS